MYEVHALWSLEWTRKSGEYYKGGRSLLPTSLPSSSSARDQFGHTGGRGHMPMHPHPTGVRSTLANALFCKVPDTRIFQIHASAQHISWNLHHTWVHPHSADTQMQRNLWKVMTQPGIEPGTFLYRGGCSNHWAIGLGRCSGRNFLVSWTSFRV